MGRCHDGRHVAKRCQIHLGISQRDLGRPRRAPLDSESYIGTRCGRTSPVSDTLADLQLWFTDLQSNQVALTVHTVTPQNKLCWGGRNRYHLLPCTRKPLKSALPSEREILCKCTAICINSYGTEGGIERWEDTQPRFDGFEQQAEEKLQKHRSTAKS